MRVAKSGDGKGLEKDTSSMHVLRSEKRREESITSVVVAVASGEILGDPEGAALIKTKRKATVTAYQLRQ